MPDRGVWALRFAGERESKKTVRSFLFQTAVVFAHRTVGRVPVQHITLAEAISFLLLYKA